MPFKRGLALQHIPLSKDPFKTQPRIENEDITWSPQHNPPVTRTNKCRASSLQEVKLDDWFLILHIVPENMYHVIHAQVQYELRISFLYSSIDVLDLNQPFDWRAQVREPFKMKLIWGLQSWPLNRMQAPNIVTQIQKILVLFHYLWHISSLILGYHMNRKQCVYEVYILSADSYLILTPVFWLSVRNSKACHKINHSSDRDRCPIKSSGKGKGPYLWTDVHLT